MKEIFDKLSSYNIFNYLFPGILFVVIVKAVSSYDLTLKDNFLGSFVYYFTGMTISRFGSIFIEPFLKAINFLKFKDYKKYVVSSKKDSKIELLSEVNNTYRTLISMMVLILLLKLYNHYQIVFKISNNISLMVLAILTAFLYLFSYRKQTNYISKRIEANN